MGLIYLFEFYRGGFCFTDLFTVAFLNWFTLDVWFACCLWLLVVTLRWLDGFSTLLFSLSFLCVLCVCVVLLVFNDLGVVIVAVYLLVICDHLWLLDL